MNPSLSARTNDIVDEVAARPPGRAARDYAAFGA
jgi:hypothetical protein